MTRHDPGLSDEQLEILRVFETDLASYLARDKVLWEESWVRDDRFRSVMDCGTLQVAQSYDAFRRNVFEAMDADPEPVEAEVRFENLQIEILGEIAWATFDEVIGFTSNPHVLRNLSHNVRILERAGGRWRILFHGGWSEPLRDIPTPAIEVAADCRVLWMNAAASERLKTYSALTISQGTLRAARPSWDAGLRETVARSQRLTGFGRFNVARGEGSGTLGFPVVLGEDDEGALMTCRVRIADGRVYVLFADEGDLSREIDAVSVLFGLSEAQAALLGHIAAGRDLGEAAEAMGVSKNTARTHLRRVFEKTGTGSQIALLRLLMSFGD